MAMLGIDFGTSNSAIGVWQDGAVQLVDMGAGDLTLPTSVFFDPDARQVLYGASANAALIAGIDGRFMRALKSVLGTSLMHERRVLLGRRTTFVEVIGDFLAMLKHRAEMAYGQSFDAVVAGRPVHFHSADAGRDAQAAKDLADCYRYAGFREVRFLAEPEAAALATGAAEGLGLILDIGGGTSDFTLFEGGRTIKVLTSRGIRLGGTHFDRALSVDHAMPLLGRGGRIGREMGQGDLPAPEAMFRDLATWEKIPFLYGPDLKRDVARFARLAVDPVPFQRLQTVLEDELGHDLAFAVEAGKIACNQTGHGQVDMGQIERGLAAPLDDAALAASLSDFVTQIVAGAEQTLADGGIARDQIARVIFVGGTSLMRALGDAMRVRFPGAAFDRSDPFTAVVRGLVLAGREV